MKIGGFLKFSLIDYPEKMSATIFVQGCNYRCVYCHNAELVLPERFNALIDQGEVLDFLRKRRGQLEAVVISGGEPTIDQGLIPFMEKVKSFGYRLKLDTNGSNPDILRDIIIGNLADYIAMDIKAPFEKYDSVSGVKVSTNQIKQSIDLIINSGIDHEFRTTVVKSLLSGEDIIEIFFSLKGAKKYKLQEFFPREDVLHKDFSNKNMDVFSKEEICQMQQSLMPIDVST